MTSPTIGTIISGSYGGTPFGYAFAYDNALPTGTSRPSYAINGLVNASLTWINPATADMQASLLTQLEAIAASLAAGGTAGSATAIGATGDAAATPGSAGSVIAVLKGLFGTTSTNQAASLAALNSILSAVQTQRVETLWTDDTNAIFVRVDSGGTLSWTTLAGTHSPPPGNGARPAGSSLGSEVVESRYQAANAGSGYSVGDLIQHLIVFDISTGATTVNTWLNASTGTPLNPPPATDISPLSPLPTNAATASGQASLLAALTARIPLALTFSDKSGTTSATAMTFTAAAIAANTARQFLRISNPNPTGNLIVYDKAAGTPTPTNSVTLGPGDALVYEAKVPGGPIAIAGSVAGLSYEATEGA